MPLALAHILNDDENFERALRRFKKQCEKAGIQVVKTEFQHNDMRDTGPDAAKNSIQGMLDKFLSATDSEVAPVDTQSSPPKILEPGPVALMAPAKS